MTALAAAMPRGWLAASAAVLVAVTFATGSTLARLAYDGGTNALSLTTTPNVVAALALVVLLRWPGVPMWLPAAHAARAGVGRRGVRRRLPGHRCVHAARDRPRLARLRRLGSVLQRRLRQPVHGGRRDRRGDRVADHEFRADRQPAAGHH